MAAKPDGFNPLVYDTLLWIFNLLLNLFFRAIHPRSSINIPKEGPLFFVAAPHANQFVDSIVLMRLIKEYAKRRVRFLIAAKSMDRPLIGWFAGLAGSVPVQRALDMVEPAQGTIYLPDPDTNPTLVRGNGTKFTSSQFMPGGLIVLPKVDKKAANAEIDRIVNDEELYLSPNKAFEGAVAVSQLTGRAKNSANGQIDESVVREFKGSSFGVAPKLNQKEMYDSVFEKLLSGQSCGIFPEGGSHDQPTLLPFKAGIAIMALGALEINTKCGLKIVPCGMNYFRAHKFRSQAVVSFGEAITVNEQYVEDYASGDSTRKRQAISSLLQEITDAMRNVTVNVEDYDTLMLIHAVRRLYNPTNHRLPPTMVVELNRRLAEGYEKYKEDPRIQKLKKDVMSYNKRLLLVNTRDHQLETASLPPIEVFILLLQRLLKILLLSVCVLPGLILFSPIFILGRRISIKKQKEALAASTVKYRARDVLATWKLLVALVGAPILYTLYVVILCIAVYWFGWDMRLLGFRLNLWAPDPPPVWFLVPSCYALLIASSYYALLAGEVGMDLWKSVWVLFITLLPWYHKTLQNLLKTRQQLAHDVTEIINDLGPVTYKDFERKRIVVPQDSNDVKSLADKGADNSPTSPISPAGSTSPTSPSTPGLNRTSSIARIESTYDLENAGVFSSHPTTPHARSRSHTHQFDPNQFHIFGSGSGISSLNDGYFSGGMDSAAMQSGADALSLKIRQSVKKRRERKGSGPGEADNEIQSAQGNLEPAWTLSKTAE